MAHLVFITMLSLVYIYSCIFIDKNDKVIWYNQRKVLKEYLYIYYTKDKSLGTICTVLFK